MINILLITNNWFDIQLKWRRMQAADALAAAQAQLQTTQVKLHEYESLLLILFYMCI